MFAANKLQVCCKQFIMQMIVCCSPAANIYIPDFVQAFYCVEDGSYKYLDASYKYLDASYKYLDASYKYLDASHKYLDASHK